MTLADLVYPVKALAILASKFIQIIWCSNCFTLNASDEDYCKQRVMRTVVSVSALTCMVYY